MKLVLSVVLMVLVLALLAAGILCRKKIAPVINRHYFEIAFIVAFIDVLFLVACSFVVRELLGLSYTDQYNPLDYLGLSSLACALVEFAILLLLSLFVVRAGLADRKFSGIRKKFQGGFSKGSVVCVAFFAAFVLSRIWMLGWNYSGDSSDYFCAISTACTGFNFLPTCFAKFALCGHPAFTMGFIASVGFFLVPDSTVGIQAVSLVVTLAAAIALYRTLKKLFSGSRTLPYLGVLVVFYNPAMWVMQAGLTTDYWLVLFLVFFVAAAVSERPVLIAFAALCLAFTKETAWLILFGFFLAKGILLVIRGEGTLPQRLKAAVCNRTMLACVPTIVLVVAYELLQRVVHVGLWSGDTTEATSLFSSQPDIAFNVFGFNGELILVRLQETFLCNFVWLFLIVLILVLVGMAFRLPYIKAGGGRSVEAQPACSQEKEGSSLKIVDLGICLCGALVVFLVGMSGYITFSFLRYMVPAVVLFTLIVLIVAYQKIEAKRVLIAALSVVAVAFLAQSFYPFDPVTNALFPTKDAGNTQVMSIGINENQCNNQRPSYETNLQDLWREKAIEKLLQAVDYGDDDLIIVAAEDNQTVETAVRFEVGGRYRTTVPLQNGEATVKGWDSENQRYVNRVVGDENMAIPYLYSSVLFSQYYYLKQPRSSLGEELYAYNYLAERSNTAGKYVVYFSPLCEVNEEATIEKLSQQFVMGPRKEVEYMGYVISYYEMTEKIDVPDSGQNCFFSSSGDYVTGEVVQPMSQYEGAYLLDPETVTDVANYAIDARSVALRNLSTTYSHALSDENRTVLRVGDIANVRVKVIKDGVWIRNKIYANGAAADKVLVGADDYIASVGTSLVGCSVGDTISVETVLPQEWDDVVYGLGGQQVTLQITVQGILSELDQDVESLCQTALNKSFEQYVEEVRGSTRLEGLSSDLLIRECALKSSYQPTQEEIQPYLGLLNQRVMEMCDRLGVNRDTYLADYLGLTEEQFTQASRKYAEFYVKQQYCESAYAALGYDLAEYFAD